MKKLFKSILAGLALLASPLAAQQVNVSWQDNSPNEAGFKLERRVSTGSYIQIATLGANVIAHVDSAVSRGNTYTYRVRAYNSAGDSAYSNEAVVTIPAAETIPNAPGAINATLVFAESKLTNISARASVVTQDEILIGGFAIEGNAPKTVLIRGIGPSLSQFGVPSVLPDPHLALFTAGASVPDNTNDDWSGANVAAAASQELAFPLPVGSKDAALLLTLNPGAYTVHVTGVAGGTGNALLEIYEVSP